MPLDVDSILERSPFSFFASSESGGQLHVFTPNVSLDAYNSILERGPSSFSAPLEFGGQLHVFTLNGPSDIYPENHILVLPGVGPGDSDWLTSESISDGGFSMPEAHLQQQAEVLPYRVVRDFNDSDRMAFLEATLETIRRYFEGAIERIDTAGEGSGCIDVHNAISFTCAIVYSESQRDAVYITVLSIDAEIGVHGIVYFFQDYGYSLFTRPEGSFGIVADQFELYLTPSSGSHEQGVRAFTSEAAAENMLERFLGQAGVRN